MVPYLIAPLIVNHRLSQMVTVIQSFWQPGWNIWDHLHKPSKAVARNKRGGFMRHA